MKSAEERVSEVEFVVSHLQATVDELNNQLIRLSKQVDRLERENRDLIGHQQILQQLVDSQRSLPHEKPPHY